MVGKWIDKVEFNWALAGYFNSIILFVCGFILLSNSFSFAAWDDRTCVYRNEIVVKCAPPTPNTKAYECALSYSWEGPLPNSGGIFRGVRADVPCDMDHVINPYCWIEGQLPMYFYFDPKSSNQSYPHGVWLSARLHESFTYVTSSSFADNWNSQPYPVLDFANGPYPTECSSPPAPEPESIMPQHTPNTDTGKPECPQVSLN